MRTPQRCDTDDLAGLNLVGESAAWKTTLHQLRRIADGDATTLIEGETGTGKELVARALHYLSARRDLPFIPLNCGALPDNLLETELFGHEKGAFTDARERRDGLVAEARGGTLLLDEVEAMSPRAQVVLLRFLQDQTYLPVGGRAIATADVRIIAASNANLHDLVDRQQFRRDLLFRLCVLQLHLPPLRERAGDITLLAHSFLERLTRTHQRPPRRLSAQSCALLEAHRWPGNVRELEGVILREFLMHDGDSDELTITRPPGAAGGAPTQPPVDFKHAKAQAVAEFERTYLRQLLDSTRGNVSLASRLSKKDRSALNKLVKKHGINTAEFRGP
jgi:DNA-binding NtrC family response regulator